MCEKNVEVVENESVEKSVSKKEIANTSNHRNKEIENKDCESTSDKEVSDTSLRDIFITERVDPVKLEEWRDSNESVLREIQTNKFMIDLDLESENDMKELEKVVLEFDKAREKQCSWEPQYIIISEIKNGKESMEDRRDDSDKTLYMKILSYGWMIQGKINRALEWGKRESEMGIQVVTEDYSGYYHITSPFCPGDSLGELAQFVKDSDLLLDKIYETAKEVKLDSGREDNLAAIAGAYALRGDLTTARNIINEDIQYSKEAKDKARAQLAIALGKRRYIDEACNIIEDLPKHSRMGFKDAKHNAIANLEEQILEKKGSEYLVELFVDIPWVFQRLIKLIGKLKVKGKREEARELAFAAVNHQPLLDARADWFDSVFELDYSECESLLREGQIHEELRNEFLERGFLIGEDAYLTLETEWDDMKTWGVSEDGLIKYTITKNDDMMSINQNKKMKETPAEIFSWLMDDSSIPYWIKEKYGENKNISDNKR